MAYTSARVSTGLLARLLGSHVGRCPHRCPERQGRVAPEAQARSWRCRSRALAEQVRRRPRSTNTLAGLRSRWITPRWWACSTAPATSRKRRTRSFEVERFASAIVRERLTLDEVHHEVGQALGRASGVEHARDALDDQVASSAARSTSKRAASSGVEGRQRNHFERHLATHGDELLGQEDLSGSPAPQPSEDAIGTDVLGQVVRRIGLVVLQQGAHLLGELRVLARDALQRRAPHLGESSRSSRKSAEARAWKSGARSRFEARAPATHAPRPNRPRPCACSCPRRAPPDPCWSPPKTRSVTTSAWRAWSVLKRSSAACTRSKSTQVTVSERSSGSSSIRTCPAPRFPAPLGACMVDQDLLPGRAPPTRVSARRGRSPRREVEASARKPR